VFNATSNEGDYDAVVSLGLGDARVLLVRNFSATWVTDTQFPLRATPPLIATRPFSIEAAYLAPSGWWWWSGIWTFYRCLIGQN